MVYFVYVRYEFDKVKKVTTSNHVKDFMPESCSDFEVGRLYSVYWEGDSRTAGAYYDAEILHMTGMRAEQTASCSCGKGKEKSQPATRSEATWSPMHGDHTDALHSGQVPQGRPPVSQQLFTGLDSAAFPGQLRAEAAPAETQPPQDSRPHPPLAGIL
ncbi:uncharacterized protein LOC119378076 [Rhipicephalus sanguineus]|uniref:uncharacterized protein LOC119378076 n=1 Tax=Rhipicephalus sanguineus TaxID=34632 RepID=UPI0020C3C6F8|nr:uncharacterized protein LOC119378076 [Rhipicephalus sanguineus]